MVNFLRKFRISLRWKILILFLFLVTIVMLTVTYIFTIRELNLRVEQVKLRMEQLANNIATIRSVEARDWNEYQSYIDNQIRLNQDIVYIAIFDEQDKLQSYVLNLDWIELGDDETLVPDERDIVLQLDQGQIAAESQKDLESKSVQIISGDENLGTVKVGFSLVELNDEMRNNLIRNLNLAIVYILLAIIISLFVSSARGTQKQRT